MIDAFRSGCRAARISVPFPPRFRDEKASKYAAAIREFCENPKNRRRYYFPFRVLFLKKMVEIGRTGENCERGKEQKEKEGRSQKAVDLIFFSEQQRFVSCS